MLSYDNNINDKHHASCLTKSDIVNSFCILKLEYSHASIIDDKKESSCVNHTHDFNMIIIDINSANLFACTELILITIQL